jgi:hypothetical protein
VSKILFPHLNLCADIVENQEREYLREINNIRFFCVPLQETDLMIYTFPRMPPCLLVYLAVVHQPHTIAVSVRAKCRSWILIILKRYAKFSFNIV